jgi:hypothetical protein
MTTDFVCFHVIERKIGHSKFCLGARSGKVLNNFVCLSTDLGLEM